MSTSARVARPVALDGATTTTHIVLEGLVGDDGKPFEAQFDVVTSDRVWSYVDLINSACQRLVVNPTWLPKP